MQILLNKFFWPLAILFFLVITYSLFIGNFSHDWVYDDAPVIIENVDIQSLSDFWDNKNPGRPVRELSLMLDRSLFGMTPTGWHVQHLFWHGLNGFLVFALMLRLGGNLFAALIAGLIFLAHPLQVEVVANLSHRKGNLSLAFTLISLHSLMFAYDHSRKLLWWTLALAFAAVGAMAYQVVYVLPLMWLFYEALFVSQDKRVLARFPLVPIGAFVFAIIGSLVWYFQYNGGEYLLSQASYALFKFNYFAPVDEWLYLLMLLKSWAFMFLKLVWPFDLAVEYVYALPSDWQDPWVLGAVAGLILWGVFVVWSWRKSRLACFALMWIAVFWIPVANIYPTAYFAADRYMYTPMVGFAMVCSIVLAWVASRQKIIAGFLVILVVGSLIYLSVQQNRVWRSNYHLFAQAFRVNPSSPTALNDYGVQLIKRGKLKEGLPLIEKAAANPFNFEANMNAAMVYERLGEKEKAAYYYKRAGDPHGGRQFKYK